MKRRKLRPDEEELWRKVVSGADRLHPEKPLDPQDLVATSPSLQAPRKKATFHTLPKSVSQPASRPSSTADMLPAIADQIRGQALKMDSKAFGQMTRGKLRPEGKIDLHGMTLDRAHPALTRFVLGAQAQGKRLILVVTGKGKQRDDGGPIPVRFGVLRHQVPQWLSLPPLSSAVLQVTQAHLRHGGGGAYYVYLRRTR
ncbi:MAG: Smr/MutS family protein [Tateyamaria sp.]|uniref:Smr/MutS family protein n=1 Tax=Tateyamaria sp. TaxID=1929288 RepID=UPI003281566A